MDIFQRVKSYLGKMALKKSYNKEVVHILWTGRFLKLKHPELLIKALYRISADGNMLFDATFVGDGPQKANAIKLVKKYNLENKIHFMDFIKPVRYICMYKQSPRRMGISCL